MRLFWEVMNFDIYEFIKVVLEFLKFLEGRLMK